jgi:hypothetical protein
VSWLLASTRRAVRGTPPSGRAWPALTLGLSEPSMHAGHLPRPLGARHMSAHYLWKHPVATKGSRDPQKKCRNFTKILKRPRLLRQTLVSSCFYPRPARQPANPKLDKWTRDMRTCGPSLLL